MRIEVRCFAGLTAAMPPDKRLDVPENATVALVMEQLGLRPDDVKLIFLNGVHAESGAELRENDRLAFVPAVGGG